jgi:putative transposase
MNQSFFPLRGYAHLRTGRISEVGRIYLVTFCTVGRAAIFSDQACARAFVRSLNGRSLFRQSRLLCWVLMPDHWHGLVELGAADSLSTLLARVKGSTARAVNLARSARGMVWDAGFHDHAVRKDDDLVSIARYVVANPVRGGLARRVGDYPYWDAVWLDEKATRAIDEEHRG